MARFDHIAGVAQGAMMLVPVTFGAIGRRLARMATEAAQPVG